MTKINHLTKVIFQPLSFLYNTYPSKPCSLQSSFLILIHFQILNHFEPCSFYVIHKPPGAIPINLKRPLHNPISFTINIESIFQFKFQTNFIMAIHSLQLQYSMHYVHISTQPLESVQIHFTIINHVITTSSQISSNLHSIQKQCDVHPKTQMTFLTFNLKPLQNLNQLHNFNSNKI